MNRDFVEMLSALSDAAADYLVVGAHALAAHGIVRATGDLAVWVRPSPENAQCVWRALQAFGAPLDQITREDLTASDLVFQIGVVPHRIDILTAITGIEFEAAWNARSHISLEGLTVPVLSRGDLIANKRATGRPRDLTDIDALEAQKSAD